MLEGDSGADVTPLRDLGPTATPYVSFTRFTVLRCTFAVIWFLLNYFLLALGELYLPLVGSIRGDAMGVYMPQWFL